MVHLIKCPHVAPLWRACNKFCHQVLGKPLIHHMDRAIILGTRGTTLLQEPTRAFLRHAFGAFYASATKVHKEGAIFHKALISLRDAALRYRRRIRLMYILRLYTNLTNRVPQTDRQRFGAIVQIEDNGKTHLSPAFTAALDNAKKASDTRLSARGLP